MAETVYAYNKMLKCGYTTGSCASAGAKASAYMLLSQNKISEIEYITPSGEKVIFQLKQQEITENYALCAIEKYSGDDPDVTSGMLIYTKVEKISKGFVVDGGKGIGRVTQKGLDQPVGAAAINSVPRKSIEENLREVADNFEYYGGLKATVFAPDGEEIAKKTMNPQLGIVGGISILGTTGIVRPMSDYALKETIKLEISMKRQNSDVLVLTPGNYGEVFAFKNYGLKEKYMVKSSNFIGFSIDCCVENNCKKILLIGHIGKFAKLGCGIMNTHSHNADGRIETIVTCGLRVGADLETLKEVAKAVTTDDAIDILKERGFLEKTMELLMEKIYFYINKRSGEMPAEAIVFSNKYGILGKTAGADEILKELK